MSDSPEYDLLAAEYVIGLLDPQEARVVRAAAQRDPAMRGAIALWQARLAPLSLAIPEVAPPTQLWAQIERRIDGGRADASAVSPPSVPPQTAPQSPPPARASPLPPVPPPRRTRPRPTATANFAARRSKRRWQFATFVSLAVAASVAVFAVLREPAMPPATIDVAVLAQPDGSKPAFVAIQYSDGSVGLRPLIEVNVLTGRDLELWVLPPGAKAPTSLGVLPVGGRRFVPAQVLPPHAQLLVSLEQAGGSPTGQPQGPVLYAGTLTSLPGGS